MEVLTLAVLSQLHARANFHRIAREWFYGDPPATELGRQEAEFYAQRRRRRRLIEPERSVDREAWGGRVSEPDRDTVLRESAKACNPVPSVREMT